jgi:hypothetical protein
VRWTTPTHDCGVAAASSPAPNLEAEAPHHGRIPAEVRRRAAARRGLPTNLGGRRLDPRRTEAPACDRRRLTRWLLVEPKEAVIEIYERKLD